MKVRISIQLGRNPFFIRSFVPTLFRANLSKANLSSRNPFFIRSFVPTFPRPIFPGPIFLVAIPSSSGHLFPPFQGRSFQGRSFRGRNPFFIRSFVPTRRMKMTRDEITRVAIPSSSGHLFPLFPGPIFPGPIFPSQSLLHQVICSHLPAMPHLLLRRLRRNPFFIRSFVPTLSHRCFHLCRRQVAIPSSSGHLFPRKR